MLPDRTFDHSLTEEEPPFTERAALLFVRDGGVLLIRHKLDDGSFCWTLPGGKTEDNETLLQTALREFSEEVGQGLVYGDISLIGCGGRTSYYFHHAECSITDAMISDAFAKRNLKESSCIVDWIFIPISVGEFAVHAGKMSIRGEDKTLILSGRCSTFVEQFQSSSPSSGSDFTSDSPVSDSDSWYSSDRSDSDSTDDISDDVFDNWDSDYSSVDEKECLKTSDWGWLGLPKVTTRARVDSILHQFGLKRGPYKSKAFAYHLRGHPDREYADWVSRAIDIGVD